MLKDHGGDHEEDREGDHEEGHEEDHEEGHEKGILRPTKPNEKVDSLTINLSNELVGLFDHFNENSMNQALN